MIQYDPHKWRTTFFAVRGSMLRAITARASFVTLVAAAITVFHFEVHPLKIANPLVVHGIISTAMGMLLVFRTNASYDRWWEGRKLWGAMLNTCRNMARAASVHLDNGDALFRVLRLTQAFPAAAMAHLRGKKWEPEHLEADDLTNIALRSHTPTAICQRITYHLDVERRAGRLNDFVFTTIDANNQQLIDIIGGCERIHKTPLPFAYVVHLRRALVIYCATLPIGLVEAFGWFAVPVTFLVAYVLLGIEEIGVEIEDPFEGDDNDLPLPAITENIQKSVGSYLPIQPQPRHEP